MTIQDTILTGISLSIFTFVGLIAVQETKRKLFNFHSKEYTCYFIIGRKRFGKSVFLEWAAEKYAKAKYLVLDMFDSGDFESCYWAIPTCPTCIELGTDPTPLGYRRECNKCSTYLRGYYCSKCKLDLDEEKIEQKLEHNLWEWKKLTNCPSCGTDVKKVKTDYKIILVYPSNATVKSHNPKIVPMSSEVGFEKIIKRALKEDCVISVATGLFGPDELYLTLSDWLFEWIDLKRDKIRTDAVICIREAANVAFSQHKISEFQGKMRKAIINLIRFAGHYQTVILFDTQRFKDLHAAARDVVETIVIKRHTFHGMPDVVEQIHKSLQFERHKARKEGAEEYDLIKHLTFPTELFKNEFIARFDDGYYVKWNNGMPQFHHKGPNDFFLDYAGLDVVKEPHKFWVKDAQNVRQVPKHILQRLAYQLVEEYGVDLEIVSEIVEYTPKTVNGWIGQYIERRERGTA